MNFENYNKIYKEILDDENGEISANYLLNKYEIKHDEELLNILNQIKKNEYISSDNKVINRIISELDSNDNLLNINEIINIKDKVIDISSLEEDDTPNNTNQTSTIEEIVQDKTKNYPIIDKKKNSYIVYAIGLIVVGGLSYFLLNLNSKEKKAQPIAIKLEKKTIQKVEDTKEEKIALTAPIIKEKIKEVPNSEIRISETKKDAQELEKKDKEIVLETKKEKISEKISNKIPTIKKEIKPIIVEKSNSEENLNKLEKHVKKEATPKIITNSNDSIKLNNLEEVAKYLKELKYQNNAISFRNDLYKKGDNLFGFKIFKLTPLYVKLEDTKKRIRKRYIFKK